jgi:hypothetical protein
MGALAPRQRTILSLHLSAGRRIVAALLALLFATALSFYILDEMYTLFLVLRATGDDLQVASRITPDADWFYNEYFWMRGKAPPLSKNR